MRSGWRRAGRGRAVGSQGRPLLPREMRSHKRVLGEGCLAVRTARSMLLEATAGMRSHPEPQGGLWSSSCPSLQREGGRQQGGAGHPGVLQGQGEARGVSWRVSAWGGAGGGGSPPARGCWPFMLPPPLTTGMSPWSCRLCLCTPSPTTTSPSPGPRQVSAPPAPSPPRDGLRQGQGRDAGPSSTHPPTPSPRLSCS